MRQRHVWSVGRRYFCRKINYNKNYYDTLNIPTDASITDIKRSFLKIARVYHPDMNADKSEDQLKEIVNKYVEAQEAYDILSNKDKRRAYDAENTVRRYRGETSAPGAPSSGRAHQSAYRDAQYGGKPYAYYASQKSKKRSFRQSQMKKEQEVFGWAQMNMSEGERAAWKKRVLERRIDATAEEFKEDMKAKTKRLHMQRRIALGQNRGRFSMSVFTLALCVLWIQWPEIRKRIFKKGERKREEVQHSFRDVVSGVSAELTPSELSPSELAVAMYGPYRTSEEKGRIYNIESQSQIPIDPRHQGRSYSIPRPQS